MDDNELGKIGAAQNVETLEESRDVDISASDLEYISGWQHHLIIVGICIILFIAMLETSIVSTALLAITNDLKGFNRSSWIFTAYMLTYACLLITWAKLSDLFGRKPLLLAAIATFIIFSGACGSSKTMNQLIVFRCFQGAGASGIYAIAVTLVYELHPPRLYSSYTSMVALILTMSATFGPLIGGSISSRTTWRWVFLLNVPTGAIALSLLIFLLPLKIHNQQSAPQSPNKLRFASALRLIQQIDILGALSLIGGGAMIITALEQAALGNSFSSAIVLGLLICAGLLWVFFFVWEWYVSTKRSFPDPIFPWRFITNRICVGMLLNTFFSGTIFLVSVVQIPQRFQTVNGVSALNAGTRLIPFSLLVPFAAAIAASALGKSRVSHVIILVIGALLEIAGTVGLSRTSTSLRISSTQYGFQILTGMGVGVFTGGLVLLAPFIVEKRDLAIATAAVSQFRFLGGLLGIAIVTSIMNRSIHHKLLEFLSDAQVNELFRTTNIISSFDTITTTRIRIVFGQGYNLQMRILIGFAVAQIPATFLMWTKERLMSVE